MSTKLGNGCDIGMNLMIKYQLAGWLGELVTGLCLVGENPGYTSKVTQTTPEEVNGKQPLSTVYPDGPQKGHCKLELI